MSQTKKLKGVLLTILALFSFFMFGCKQGEVAVNKIDVNLDNQSQVVLLVDEFFDLSDRITVSPNYASDKTFSIFSMNENVIRVVGNQLKAISSGEAMVRIVSNSDENIEEVISVVVYDTQTQLDFPTNLKYNETSQTFTFNPVDNAASYTISINEREFNIGNVTAFELASYVGEKYNNVLSVKVKANASTYGKAFLASTYGETLKVYQTKEVQDAKIEGGKLTYSVNTDLVYDIYFDNIKFIENTTLNQIDLTALSEDYAGQIKKVSIVAKPSEKTKQNNGNDVKHISSKSEEMVLNILAEPNIEMVGSSISWNAIPFADGYTVVINNSNIYEVENNYCDLKELEIYNQIESSDGQIEVKVLSKLSSSSKNVAKTVKFETISFSRLATPVISTVANGIEWTEVENAIAYYVEVKKDGKVEFAGSTSLTNFDLSNLGAANYSIEVSAIGYNSTNNYISSRVASTTIDKHAQPTAEISNYVLNINTVQNETYLVDFIIDDNNSYNKEILATNNSYSIDLSGYNFKPGVHDIKIKRLGNGNSSINGEVKTISFTQLEAVSVSISNSIASISRSAVNNNAEIYLETKSASLAESIKVKSDSYQFNTTDKSKEYLPAGEYSVVAYVCGNGSSTFSYREGKQEIACGEAKFTVLEVPSLSVLDKSTAEVSVNKVNYATNYSILDENEMLIETVNEKYSFALESGATRKFSVRANGDGKTTLTSLSSANLAIKRLTTPELTFDAENNSFDIIANNDNSLYEKVNFYYNNGMSEYSFGETFAGLKDGENRFKINLVSKGVVEGVNYINSLTNEIAVYKLTNELTANVNSSNKLNILNPENGELVLAIDGVEYVAENGAVAGLDYVVSANKYVITLLDSNYNAKIPSMVDGFTIKAKFVKQNYILNNGLKIYYTSSEWSDECKLYLQSLATTNAIYSNSNNQIIIENPNSEKLYLDLILNVDGTDLKFEDNSREQLVHDETILTYEYKSNKYYIDLYETNNIKIQEILQGDIFGIKAQFRKTISGSDIDSAISSNTMVTYLNAPKFNRNAQSLNFVSQYKNYELDKYKLFINGNSFAMSEFGSKFTSANEGGLTKYTITMIDLWDLIIQKMPGFTKTDINSLAISILNTATTNENVLLGSLGEEIYVQQATSFTVSTVKNAGLTNVEVAWQETGYEKVYSLDVLGYVDSNKDISINLDALTFSGDLKIEGFVKAESTYVKDFKNVYVFNSIMSNSLTVTRLAAPSLDVVNNKIIHTTISGANGYEVYLLSAGSVYEKVDESRLLRDGNSFEFNDLGETEEFTIAVKAVTTNAVVLNSNLSEAIVVKKLARASAGILGGKVGITIPSECLELIESVDVSVKISLNLAGNIYNCEIGSDYSTSVYGITWSPSNNAFMVDSGLIFGYTEDYIQEKQLTIKLELNGKHNNKNYLYSNTGEAKVKGLFAPTDIMVDKQDASFEKISWSNNAKNKLAEGASLISIEEYVFAFIYEGETYYSTDANLKYLSGGSYLSYGEITGTNAAFPYGYDANNDGDFVDENDVIFTTGEYMVMVAAATDGYATSPYSSAYSFRVMPTTTVSIENGKLTWTEVTGATKYIVRVKEYSTITVVKTVEVSGLTYDFEDFVLNKNLFDVTVQAITDKEDTLNSKESNPLTFYRLPNATKIEFDNGMIKITASPFASAIDVGFNGKTYRFTNPNQEENLTNAALKGFMSGDILGAINGTSDVVYGIDLVSDNLELIGKHGAISVRLCGNTGTREFPSYGNVGLVNSQTIQEQTNTTAQVLKTNVNSVAAGVWKFSQNMELGTTEKVKINYNFNNVDAIHSFWLNSIVYKINVDTYNQGEVKNDEIYAVDYYRFIDAVNANELTTDTTAQTYYELCQDKNDLYARVVYKYGTNLDKYLYTNVYKENIINLQDYDVLFYYSMVDNGNFTYSSEQEIKTISLASGGSFVVNIGTLGGDGGYSYAYLNSSKLEQTFVRFGRSYVSTKAGQLVFADLKAEGYVSPVYKVVVRKVNEADVWNVYLYNQDECTEQDVRTKFNLTAADICVPIILLTGSNEIAFEMGNYFSPAAYNVDVRAMAGVGADNYLLNAKKPTEEDRAIVKILTSPTPVLTTGNLTFGLSNVNNDGTYVYSNNYEIVVKYNGVEYVEKISSSSADVLIEGTNLTYTIPESIGGLNLTALDADGNTNTYYLKVRALTNADGIINSPFKDTNPGDDEDDYLTFTRNTSVADVKIENGILKWVGEIGVSKYLIKIFDNNNNQTILIDNGYTSSGNVYSYQFMEQEYTILGEGTKTKILPEINYTIGVSKVGNSSNIISSAYTDCANVFRKESVNASEFVAKEGLLTWVAIDGNNGYNVKLIDTTSKVSYEYIVGKDVTSIDLSLTTDTQSKILPAGSYNAYIRTLGNDKINSLQVESLITFAKLNKVTNYTIDGSVISWNAIENAQGYKVKFNYTNTTGIPVEQECVVSEPAISSPTDVQGRLTITLIAYAGNSNSLLNSDALVVTTSSDAPKPIYDLVYNTDANRFEWKVNVDDFTSTDNLFISYDFVEYSENGNLDSVNIKILMSMEQEEYYDEENGIYYKYISNHYDTDKGVYYLPATIMGGYVNFKVAIYRHGAVPAECAPISKGLNLFSYGAGTKEKPYVINNEQSFINIKYYPNAYFKLISDITISGTYTYAIQTTEFTGNLDGNNMSIDFGNVNLENVQEFALFASLNGAIINNLNILGNITNIISTKINGDVRMALLAIESKSSTLENVKILTSSIVVSEKETNSNQEINGSLYLAGFFASDIGSTLTSCRADKESLSSEYSLKLSSYLDLSNYIYNGAVAAYAERTNVRDSNIKLSIENSKNSIYYLGGLFGRYVGNSDNRSSGVFNSTVDITISNIKALYIGGIAGHAQFMTVQNNEIAGNINYTSIGNEDIFFGGVIGVAISSLIYSNTMSADISIVLGSANATIAIGKLIGSIEISNDVTFELKGLYSEADTTAIKTNESLVLGLYGQATDKTKLIIDKNYTLT